MNYRYCLIPMLILLPVTALTQESRGWIVTPYIGFSSMGDVTGTASNVDGLSGSAEVNLDEGFVAGIDLAYQYNQRVSAAIRWEYRSNDSQVNLSNSREYDDGNYASNTLFIDGRYTTQSLGNWQPYLGAGIGWLQEIDLDLEGSGEEISLSDDGNIGFQVFAGLHYSLNQRWRLESEIRYTKFDDIDLESEGDSGRIQGLDYDPITFQFGLGRSF